jgi:hypothetical protein
VEIFSAILRGVNGDGSVPDDAIEDVLDALELRLLIDRVRACSGCAGDYEDPDRSQWGLDDLEAEEGPDEDGPSGGAEAGT